MKRTSLKKCRELVAELRTANRGFTSSDYTDSIAVKKPFLIFDGNQVRIDWDSVEDWAQEVAARTLFDHLNPDTQGP